MTARERRLAGDGERDELVQSERAEGVGDGGRGGLGGVSLAPVREAPAASRSRRKA